MPKSTDLAPPTAPELVSQAEFAREMGVSKVAVTKWKAAGRLVIREGLVDVSATKANLDRYRVGGSEPRKEVDAAPVNQPVNEFDEVNAIDDGYGEVNADDADAIAAEILRTTGTAWTIDEAKRVKESFLALSARLRYDLEAAAVVPVAEVARAVTAEYASVRTRLLAVPAEHAPQVARLRTPAEVRDYLERVITEILTALSSGSDAPQT